MTVRMTPEEFSALRSKADPKARQAQAPSPEPIARPWWKQTALWLLVTFLLGLGIGRDQGSAALQSEVDSLSVRLDQAVQAAAEADLDLQAATVEATKAAERAEDELLQRVEGMIASASVVVAEPLQAITVSVPNEPEQSGLPEALIALGATATCPGECLEWRDQNGLVVYFRFNP